MSRTAQRAQGCSHLHNAAVSWPTSLVVSRLLVLRKTEMSACVNRCWLGFLFSEGKHNGLSILSFQKLIFYGKFFMLIWDFQTPKLWEINVCCLTAQCTVFCARSPCWRRPRWLGAQIEARDKSAAQRGRALRSEQVGPGPHWALTCAACVWGTTRGGGGGSY